jgi:hypothetical protein
MPVWFPPVVRLAVAIGCLGLALAATACGGSSGTALSTTTKRSVVNPVVILRQRLIRRGYTVVPVPSQPAQAYVQAIRAVDVDWASTHTFDVDMFVFASSDAAAHFVKKNLEAVPAAPGSRWKQEGKVLFEASTTETGLGDMNCTFVNGSPKCQTPPSVPLRDFLNVVGDATGQRHTT